MTTLLLGWLLSQATPATATITIDPSHVVAQSSPHLWGVFFEEINCAGDGGLYAELVRNRGFEDADKPEHWTPIENASVTVDKRPGGQYLSVKGRLGSGVRNAGYWGMFVEFEQKFVFSAEIVTAYPEAVIGLVLRDDRGNEIGRSKVPADKAGFVETEIEASGGCDEATLDLVLEKGPMFVVDNVSLFPKDTWKGRKNGLRKDLAETLDGLKPAFVRFPGGCWVEGDTMASAYRWKTTLGDLGARATVPNLWGYKSTNGLGYHEYLLMCEDLGAEPLFVINCGMSHKEVVPMDKMGEFVQDALDAVEYANGPVSSKWGAQRAANGHPEPFGLKYLEIGNENGGPAYEERYGLIYRAVKAKYPDLKIIANVWGGVPQKSPVEIIDEHYYSNPDFFIQNATRYDTYDRKGPKVYVGEYAVTQGSGNGNLIAAVAEAAFMTGMERNSDHVVMSSYAPLFANLNKKAWNPDLIYFNASRVYGTPSYFVQQMFSVNRVDSVVKATVSPLASAKKPFPAGGIGIGTWNTQAEFKDIKVTNGSETLFESKDGVGMAPENGQWKRVEGAARQEGDEQPARKFSGSTKWTDYTLTLKARRLSGAEGFLVSVGRKDAYNYLWLNLGGWGNSLHAIEWAKDNSKSLVGKQKPGTIETGKWYDVKVEYSASRVRCWLDGELLFDEVPPEVKTLHVSAGMDQKRGELVVKLVNSGDTETEVTMDTKRWADNAAAGWVLTSSSPMDENSLDKPHLVVPKPVTVQGQRTLPLRHRLPACSVTVLRFSKLPK